MTVKERLIEYLKSKKISKSDFGRAIGVSNSYVTSIRKSIDKDKLQSIASKFPDLNIEWLLYGKGEMLKENGVVNQKNEISESNINLLLTMLREKDLEITNLRAENENLKKQLEDNVLARKRTINLDDNSEIRKEN
jgi:transcriptional regulator with XRE-family HTH domain